MLLVGEFGPVQLIGINGRNLCIVDRLRITADVFSHLVQNGRAGFGNPPLRIRPHIQQAVAAPADRFQQQTDQLIGTFPLVVIFIVTPGIIDCGRDLPGSRGIVLSPVVI